jgi:hypothetical protein
MAIEIAKSSDEDVQQAGGLQLRLKVFDLDALGFLEILCTQKLFHEIPVCYNFPLKVCLVFLSGRSTEAV